MKKPRLPLQMMRPQFVGLGILGLMILVGQIIFRWYKNQREFQPIKIEIVEVNENKIIELSKFNPNNLSAEEWRNLGFTEGQVRTILNYKDLVGGAFVSKEQLAKCYAISEEKFAQLSPYILLPEKKEKAQNQQYSREKKSLNIAGKFNPDHYSKSDWQNLGFSEKQAEAILKYKNYLGGSFQSKEKFKECFVISEENYRQLSPYLILPEKVENIKPKSVENQKEKIKYSYFDPNDFTLQDWQKIGFSEKQAQVIINYKERNLKGKFRTLEDIEKCFVISSEKFEEMKPWIRIKKEEVGSKEEKSQREEGKNPKTDFSKIDLNQINYNQLVEFGFDEKGARSFLGFRKRLGGFMEKNQVLETYNLDKNLAKNLIEIAFLENQNISKYDLKNAPEDFLKNHPYFRKHADKIIFYRITFSSDKEILKKINATSEEVAKMKLYLK